MRAKIIAGADYLAVAPRVVAVVRDLDLPDVARLHAPDADSRAEAEAFGRRWGAAAAMGRALSAVSAAAG